MFAFHIAFARPEIADADQSTDEGRPTVPFRTNGSTVQIALKITWATKLFFSQSSRMDRVVLISSSSYTLPGPSGPLMGQSIHRAQRFCLCRISPSNYDISRLVNKVLGLASQLRYSNQCRPRLTGATYMAPSKSFCLRNKTRMINDSFLF